MIRQPVLTSTERPPFPLDGSELEAWRSFLHAQATIRRRLDAELAAAHDLTLSDYEVLLALARAPGRRLRMSDLADRVLLTRSGITRLVDGLTRAGLVRRTACPTDARVSYAQLTDAGDAKLLEAEAAYLEGVRTLFTERFSGEELEALASLLARLPGAEGAYPAG